METILNRLPGGGAKLLSTRRGTLTVAAVVAGIAALVLIVFMQQYRSDVSAGTAPATVLVADRLIPKGTSGDAIASERLFKPMTVSEDRLVEGAVVDAQALAGKTAVADIYPGRQISATDFQAGADPVRGQLSGADRAITVPVGAAAGSLQQLRDGDRIDVLVSSNGNERGTGLVTTLLADVLVLDAPAASEEGAEKEANVTLRVSDEQAAKLAYASDNGRIWFTLRPTAGASDTRSTDVTLQSLANGRVEEAGK